MKKSYFIVGLVALLASCTNAERAQTEIPEIGTLEKTRWALSRVPLLDSMALNLPQPVYIQLDSGMLRGFAGCNSMFGTYFLSADSLRFGTVGTTKKYCDRGMEVETAIVEALHRAGRYRLNNGHLDLLAGDSVVASFSMLRPE